MSDILSTFVQRIVDWQLEAGRQHLPWQHTTDPYRIWLSEIMLQQTQVATVLGYYERFLKRFPTVVDLALASQDEVMPYWAGLGYYARARNLHKCAQVIRNQYQGRFPDSAELLATLPGIGPSTAAAIAAFAYGERAPIMDGNVKRVFCRYFGIYGQTHLRATEKQLWARAHEVLKLAPDHINMAAYTQGQMDLGAQVCTRGQPSCTICPLQTGCYALNHQAQQELPTPRAKKTTPQRQVDILIWQSGEQLLIEQRPNHGIWGGLQSLPEFEDSAAVATFLQNQGLSLEQAQKMASFSHVFSHFTLHINPWLIQQNHHLFEAQAPLAWLDLEKLPHAAFPAPLRKLVDEVFVAAN